jgi:hypothetical protein
VKIYLQLELGQSKNSDGWTPQNLDEQRHAQACGERTCQDHGHRDYYAQLDQEPDPSNLVPEDGVCFAVVCHRASSTKPVWLLSGRPAEVAGETTGDANSRPAVQEAP